MRSRRRRDKASGRVPTSVFAPSIESRAQRSESGRCLTRWRPPVPIGVSMRCKRHGWPVRKKSPSRRPQHGLHRRIRLERTAWRCAHPGVCADDTPILQHRFTRKKLSAIAALSTCAVSYFVRTIYTRRANYFLRGTTAPCVRPKVTRENDSPAGAPTKPTEATNVPDARTASLYAANTGVARDDVQWPLAYFP